ncbi:MAG: glycosyltransferase, partial [Thermohalobaculum sp.]|nr:glycosyltransferase [Thermohalobaculum sp.]
GLQPGSADAARTLAEWHARTARSGGDGGLPVERGDAAEAACDPARAAVAARLQAWWSDLAADRAADPLVQAPPPHPDAVAVLAGALRAIADALGQGAAMPCLDPEAEAALRAPVVPGRGALSGAEFALGLMSGLIGAAPDCGAGWHAQPARALAAALARQRAPWLARFASPPPDGIAPGASAPDVALIGFTRGTSGLGENLGMTAAALAYAGISTAMLGVELGLARVDPPGGDGGGDGGTGGGAVRLCRPVRLVHVNADQVPQVLLQPAIREAGGALAIGFLLWEFAVLPEAHRLALDMLDEAWCPTDFVAEAYRAAGRLPVHRIGKAVTLGPVEPADRAALGLPQTPFLFLLTFDFHSSVERKNPLAAVRAFLRAFPPARRDVGLVIKTTAVVAGHWGDPNGQWQAICDLARHDARITVLAGTMPRPRYLALMRAADCLVSPHRAEGFGYAPAQAMLLGRPAIVTDWSGTRDFCTPATSFPVPAELVAVRPGETILPLEGASWAAIDEAALAATMRAVAEDPAAARARAEAGRALMRRDYSVAAQAGRYLARLRALGVLAEAA